MLQIRIGASLDGSVQATFKQLPALARQARAQVENELNKMGQSPYRDAPAHAKRDLAKVVDATKDAATKGKAEFDKLGDAATKSAGNASRAWETAMRNIGRNSVQNFKGIARAGVGLAGGVARGAGIQLDFSSIVQKNVALEKTVTDIINSGYLEGDKGAAGKRQNAGDVQKEIRGAAAGSATDTSEVAAGLHQFVAKSSDLETGRAVLADMAKLAKATGSSMVDVADAAGDVSNKLGDVPNKAEAVRSAMLIIAQQGKLGAVEMREMAKNIAVIVGPANQFKEGTAAAINELGAAFQMTKKFGGAKGPAAAATDVANFAADLTSHAGRKNLLAGGMKESDVYADKGHTKLNDLSAIVSKALEVTKGDLTKMSDAFRNKRSGAVIKGFQEVYNQAEATEKGSGGKAVRAKFKEFGGAMSQKDLGDALAKAMDTTASKAELFNQKLETLVDSISAKLLPQLEKLAPAALSLVESFGKAANWAAANPGEAMALAAVASIAKAGIGEAIAKAIGSSAGGAIGLTLAVATATFMVTDAYFDMKNKAVDRTQDLLTEGTNAASHVAAKRRAGTLSDEDLAQAKATRDQLQSRADAAEAGQKPSFENATISGKYVSGAINYITAGSAGKSLSGQEQSSNDAAHLQEIKAEIARLNALMAGGITIKNLPGAAPSGVDSSGTTGPAR